MEILRPLHSVPPEEFFPRGDRYDGLRACIGESLCQELHKLRVFMVSVTAYNWLIIFCNVLCVYTQIKPLLMSLPGGVWSDRL